MHPDCFMTPMKSSIPSISTTGRGRSAPFSSAGTPPAASPMSGTPAARRAATPPITAVTYIGTLPVLIARSAAIRIPSAVIVSLSFYKFYSYFIFLLFRNIDGEIITRAAKIKYPFPRIKEKGYFYTLMIKYFYIL